VRKREKDTVSQMKVPYPFSPLIFSDYPACNIRKQFRWNIALNAVFFNIMEQYVLDVYSLNLIAIVNNMFYIRRRIKILRNKSVHI
jgi:hypothetical protein